MTTFTVDDLGTATLRSFATSFASTKSLADRAVAQLPDDALRRSLDPNINTIAVIMKHVAGNLRSRWTDALTSDGEKPWRQRDEEFIDRYPSRAALAADWEDGWRVLFAAIAQFAPADLLRDVVIRGESQPLALALSRSLAHTSYHVGQIVQLARVNAGETWTTLTIARGDSTGYNARTWGPAKPSGDA